MTKYKLSKQELQDHWDDQIRFIQKSIKEFDRGDEKEAQRLATHLRVLFHETQKSKSIFGQLKPQIIFYSSGDLYTPSNLFTSWTLLDLMVSPEGIKYNAKSTIISNIPRAIGHIKTELSLPDGRNDFPCLLFIISPFSLWCCCAYDNTIH